MERKYVALLPASCECSKCGKIAPKIAINRGTVITTYCSICGTFSKTCSAEEARTLYVKRVKTNANTSPRLVSLISESEATMINL